MSSVSNQNANPDRGGVIAAAAILIAALSLTLAAAPFAASGAEAAPSAAYGDSELRAVMTEQEAQIEDLRNQELKQLRLALGRRLPQNRMADLYFRVAELYLEAYRTQFLLEGRVFEKRRTEGRSDKFINRARSKSHLRAGIRACNDILRLGIPYAKLDRVHYFLGVNQMELENRDEALKQFQLLTRKFPSSPFVADAYRELGDFEFERKQFSRAQAYYEMAVEREKGDQLPRLLHKLSWAYYRTRQFDRAVSTLKDAISRSSKGGERFVSLKEEGMRDMALFMTETGKVNEALAYFQEVAGDKNYYARALERLGRQYEKNVEPAKATLVYETLLKTRPDDEASFRVLVKLVDLDLRRGRTKEALARLRGGKLLSSGESETEVAAQNLRAMVRRTATESHEQFRKDANRPALGVAEEYYSAYLALFLEKSDPRKEIPEIQMYLAEVKRELGKSKEASELYKKVLESDDKRYAKEAGALWTASLSEAIRKAGQGGAKAGGEPSKLELEFIEAADEMQESLGEVAEGREAALRAAQVLAGYPATRDDAVSRVRSIIKRWPSSPQALTAARLWVQIHEDRLPDPKAQEDLVETLGRIRGNAELMASDQESGASKLKSTLAEIDTRLKVGAIAVAEKKSDFGQAAKGYEEFAAAEAKRAIAEKAYTNAVASYVKAGDFQSVDRVTGAWMARFKGTKLAPESIRSAATVALIQGRFEEAGSLFEKLGVAGRSPESLETAGQIHQGNGDSARARRAWSVYLASYPKSPGRFAVALLAAQSYDSERRVDEAAKHYRICASGPHSFEAECGARLADLELRFRDRAAAKALYRKVASMKSKEISPFVGYSRYRLAELIEQEANFDTLQLPEAQLKKALAQRMDFIEPLSRAYQSAVDVGGPWGVAALDRLASWVFRFTSEIEAISPPAGASAEAVAQFQKSLMAISEPLQKKAIETWAKAYQTANQGEILSPALPGIGDRLSDAKAGDPSASLPSRAQGYRGRFRIAGVPADGGAEGRQSALDRVRERLTRNAQDSSAWIDYGNLLWGTGRPLLARIAYDRATALDPKSAAALNNRAVVHLSGTGQEDWARVAEAQDLFRQSLAKDGSFLPAKMNYGSLLNYYRIFGRARAVWEQVVARVQNPDAYDGLAIAQQGLGQSASAEASFARATQSGAPAKRFARVYNEAARAAAAGKAGSSQCLSKLGDADESMISGFERDAFDHLKRACRKWKNEK